MAETLTSRERALNHEDGVTIADMLARIADAMEGKQHTVIYGFHYNGNEADPDASVSYLEDAVGLTPLAVNLNTGICEYGSWKHAFFMPKPCMLKFSGIVDYYLNPNDYTLKEDGSASDNANIDYAGNCMMEFPQIWWKIVPDIGDSSSFSFYCSNTQIDSSYHAWNCFDKNNIIKDHFYVSAYQGCEDGSNRLRSISGKLHSKNKNASAIMTLAEACGPGWQIDTWADRLLLWMLCILVTKSTASQEKLGLGHTTDSVIESNMLTSGTMDKKGLFFGNSNSGTGGDGVKVFGIENYWGDQWRWTAGLFNDNGTLKYKLTQGTADGTTVNDYNADASGYLTAGVAAPSGTSGGYISKVEATSSGVYPVVASGSQSTYMCDGLWFTNDQLNFSMLGGYMDRGRLCGVSYFSLDIHPSGSNWNRGSGVSYR